MNSFFEVDSIRMSRSLTAKPCDLHLLKYVVEKATETNGHTKHVMLFVFVRRANIAHRITCKSFADEVTH